MAKNTNTRRPSSQRYRHIMTTGKSAALAINSRQPWAIDPTQPAPDPEPVASAPAHQADSPAAPTAMGPAFEPPPEELVSPLPSRRPRQDAGGADLAEFADDARQVQALHATVEERSATAFDPAVAAGRILAADKKKIHHGDFKRWVMTHARLEIRVAQQYMRLFKHETRIRSLAKANGVSHLTISAALKLIAKPKTDKQKLNARSRSAPLPLQPSTNNYESVMDLSATLGAALGRYCDDVSALAGDTSPLRENITNLLAVGEKALGKLGGVIKPPASLFQGKTAATHEESAAARAEEPPATEGPESFDEDLAVIEARLTHAAALDVEITPKRRQRLVNMLTQVNRLRARGGDRKNDRKSAQTLARPFAQTKGTEASGDVEAAE